jgi:hypothetical protein
MSDETAKLIADARIKSSTLRMGEPIAFGSDADTIDALIEALSAALSQLDATRAERDGLAQALKPFAAEKLPSMKRSVIDYDRYGLRRAISPMELACKAAWRALKHQGAET